MIWPTFSPGALRRVRDDAGPSLRPRGAPGRSAVLVRGSTAGRSRWRPAAKLALALIAALAVLAGLPSARAGSATAAGAPSASWPQYRYDPSHSGAAPAERTIDVANAGTLSLYWRFEAGDLVWSAPAVAGGVVYVGSYDGNVYALAAATGTRIWRRHTGGGIWSSPAAIDHVVYVGSDDGKLYALDAATGATLWTRQTGGPLYSAPAVANGVIYIGASNGTVLALDATNGGVLWSHATGGDYVFSSPAVADGIVYVGADLIAGQSAPHPGSLYALDAATGAEVWSLSLSREVDSSPAVAGGVVYVGCFDGNVYARDAATGAAVWSAQTGGSVWSSPAVAGGVVYVGSQDGSLHALDAASGAQLWSQPTGGPVDSSPAVANGVVYVGSTNPLTGDLYAFDASSGAKLWSYKSGDSRGIESSPAVADGVVYVGTMGDFFDRGPYRVLAFRPQPPLTISSSPPIVRYRSSVVLNVHLGLAGFTDRLVRIYRTPCGGARTFVTSARLDDGGSASLNVGGCTVTTAFTATWDGDSTHVGLTSNPVYARVGARVTAALSRYYAVSRGYHLYHYSADPKRCPLFAALVVPDHARGELDFRLQRHTSAGWNTVGVFAQGLSATSRAHVVLRPRDASVKGWLMRVRAEWPGDPRNAPSWSRWEYYRVTS